MFYVVEFELIYFAPLVSMAFELHSQIYPTLTPTPLQPLKSPYDLCYACDLSGGEWEDMQAYGRAFLLEWIWVIHTYPFKHIRELSDYFCEGLQFCYSIFECECLLRNYKLLRMFVHDILWVLKNLLFFVYSIATLILLKKVNLSFTRGRAKAKCGRI